MLLLSFRHPKDFVATGIQISNSSDKVTGMGLKSRIRKRIDNQYQRDEFVESNLRNLIPGSNILDAGAGSQRYRDACGQLQYFAQDFGRYKTDVKRRMDSSEMDPEDPYVYGPIDLICDITSIPVPDETFDAVLCTEVLEHVPYPIEAVKEMSRVTKNGGTLILTFPSNCLRHFDPFFFTTGFSDRWIEEILPRHDFEVVSLSPVGDYYRWMAVETVRTMKSNSPLAALALLPSLIYYWSKRPTATSIDTLCMGYHVIARKMIPKSK